MSLALLVDRDADTRQMYAEVLRQSAYDTEEAEDGREALAKAISHRPAVIVTETRLPGMSGLELCRILRCDAGTRAIPIVVVTADATPNNVRLAEAAGADSVLVKPCLPQRLAAEIDYLLAHSRELSERGRDLRQRADEQRAKSLRLIERSEINRRRAMSHIHQRGDTESPPKVPPALVCPACDQTLKYVKSHIGGVSERNSEQWDYFECAGCSGMFEYRHRTRKLRQSDPVRS